MFVLLPLFFLYFFLFQLPPVSRTHITHTLIYLFARYVGNKTFYEQVLHQNEKEEWEGAVALQ